MPIPPKPSVALPEWATNDDYDGGIEIGTPTKVAPLAGQQADGWRPGEPSPAQHENHRANAVGQWLGWSEAAIDSLAQGYRLVNIVVFDDPGSHTWTRPQGVRAVRVTVVGGGGGGGAASNTATGHSAAGGGGGAGAAIKWIASPGETEDVVVGAGGPGGPISPTSPGEAGESSSFGSHCSATGGGGGEEATAAITDSAVDGVGGAGGVGSDGDLNITGGNGGDGLVIEGFAIRSNIGGGSLFAPQRTSQGGPLIATGAPGNPYGGGGSGANSPGSSQVGGGGASGVVIVEEYA